LTVLVAPGGGPEGMDSGNDKRRKLPRV